MKGFREAINKRKTHKVTISRLVKLVKLALKNYCFKLLDKLYQQISGTTVGTGLPTPIHTYLWIKWKVSSYKLKNFNLFYGLSTLSIFPLYGHSDRSLKHFMTKCINFNPNINCIYDFSNEDINFLEVKVKISDSKL